jgi:redox-sensing transcriptional repressor
VEADWNNIPDVVIKRLPIYLRALNQLLASGATIVSSSELALATGSTAPQIRRDLSYFGEFGKRAKGYDIVHLLDSIREILNIEEQYRVVVVGAGPLGQAIARYGGFRENGFLLSWVYDHNPERIGTRLNDIVVEDVARMPERVRSEGVRIAILAVPSAAAQEVADLLVGAGVKAILNYAPVVLRVPDDVRVYDIDPVAALQSLTYYLSPALPRLRRGGNGLSS